MQRGGRKAGDLLHTELHLMPAYQVQNRAQQSCEKCQALKYWHQVLDSSDKTRTIIKSAARLGSPRKATSSPHKASSHATRPHGNFLSLPGGCTSSWTIPARFTACSFSEKHNRTINYVSERRCGHFFLTWANYKAYL